MVNVVESPDGFKWVYGGNDTDDHLALGGHEPALYPILQALNYPSDKAYVNIGAHVGTWAIRMAAYASEVFAVEANIETLKVLDQNIALNGLENKVWPIWAAVWDKALKKIKLVDINGKQTGGSTRAVVDNSAGQETTTLDLLFFNSDPIGLISMDVEGAEAKILAGGKGVINRDRPNMLIELHEGHPGTDPDLRKQVETLLTELNYNWNSIRVAGTEEHLICTPAERVDLLPAGVLE